MDIATLVRSLGGMAQKRQLVALGARDHHLTDAVRRGEVGRARQGWYTVLPLMDPRVRAVRVGGRLTGISAVAALGGWVLDATLLHVAVPRNAARLRSQTDRRLHPPAPRIAGVRLHWAPVDGGTAVTVGLLDALHRVILDESREQVIAALDWALHTGRVDRLEVEALMLGVPPGRRIPWAALDERCESLPESLARTRLREAGHDVRSQVRLNDVERIDLVVDGVIGLEVDGEEFHRGTFLRDRDKDAAILRMHLVPHRVPAVRVFRSWPAVLATIHSALADFGNSGVAPRKPPRKRPIRARRAWIPEFPTGEGGIGGGVGALGTT